MSKYYNPKYKYELVEFLSRRFPAVRWASKTKRVLYGVYHRVMRAGFQSSVPHITHKGNEYHILIPTSSYLGPMIRTPKQIEFQF